ncbi:hypothetical protein FRB96_003228 [Tulasnella sp. 330]|nr:hypothetical protein FRB96_003228 [Tulasnella sp. 330]KAG8874917.1 hypothetical protein FRB97_005549 [Tulasnella sp. 331]
MTPLHRLPNELLLRALLLSLGPRERGFGNKLAGYQRRARVLASVCYRWSTLVENSPLFWNLITDGFEPKELVHALSKSNLAPVDLFYGTREDYERRKGQYEFSDFILRTSGEAWRWRRLDLFLYPRDKDQIGSLEKLSLPMLEELTIVTGDQLATVKPFQLSGCRFRYLYLSGFPMDWSSLSSSLSHLRQLHLVYSSELVPSLRELTEIFRSCPGLEVLDLLLYGTPIETSIASVPPQPIPLLKLASVHLSAEPVFARHILNTIRFPNCTILRISSTSVTDDNIFSDGSLEHIEPILHSILLNAKKTWIEISPLMVEIQVTTSRFQQSTYISTYGARSSPTMINWLVNLLHSTPNLPPISMTIMGDVILSDVSPFLGSILPIRSLSVNGNRRSLPLYIDLLAGPVHEVGGTWPAKHLRRMSLKDCFFVPEHLISALRRRAAVDTEVERGSNDLEQHHPDVLEELEMDSSMRVCLSLDGEKQLLSVVGKEGLRDSPAKSPIPPTTPSLTNIGVAKRGKAAAKALRAKLFPAIADAAWGLNALTRKVHIPM